jgi:DNA-binding transcriptional LysR family regulator
VRPIYLAASRIILEQVGEAEREVTGEYLVPRGELLLTAPLSFGRRHVLPVANEFLAQHPDITLRLALSDEHMDLVGQRVDLAVRIGGLSDSQLVARRVGAMPWAVVASPAFLAAHGEPKTPADLAKVPCVGIDFINLSAWWRFRVPGAGANHNVPVRCRLAVSNGESAVDAAVAGVGLTQILLYQAAPEIAAGRLKVVLRDYEAAPLPVSIVYTGRGKMPLKTRSFLDFAAPRLKRSIDMLDRDRGLADLQEA